MNDKRFFLHVAIQTFICDKPTIIILTVTSTEKLQPPPQEILILQWATTKPEFPF